MEQKDKPLSRWMQWYNNGGRESVLARTAKTRLSEQERMVGINKENGIVMNNEIKKEEKINLTIEFVDNGAILEYPDGYMKQVVEGYDKEPFHAIADDIQGTMSGMMVSNKYQIEIKITAL